jgi:hypothetical protein
MVVAEFIPEDDTRQSSAPSSTRIFSSHVRVVGFPYLHPRAHSHIQLPGEESQDFPTRHLRNGERHSSVAKQPMGKPPGMAWTCGFCLLSRKAKQAREPCARHTENTGKEGPTAHTCARRMHTCTHTQRERERERERGGRERERKREREKERGKGGTEEIEAHKSRVEKEAAQTIRRISTSFKGHSLRAQLPRLIHPTRQVTGTPAHTFHTRKSHSGLPGMR